MLINGVVQPHSTLDALLREAGLANSTVVDVIQAARRVFDLRRLRASQPFTLERSIGGTLREFQYEIDDASMLKVSATPGELHADVLPIQRTPDHAVAFGSIDAETPSLFQAMGAAGENPELAIALAGIFAGEIDFNTEVQPQDRFGVAFDRFSREGRAPAYGEITAAEFWNGGRLIRAIRFTPEGGKADYFDEQGRSLRRFFLRSPLKFEPRITSGFSSARMHPVLHVERAHRGIDYAAPPGVPVVAIAGGSVVSATFDSVNGRMVRLRHTSGYESYYLHLSAFGSGVRAGARVDQGQVIGRVGSTGLATGPHLHYALRKHGAFVNPLREMRN
jgi:murein DD-endopeptidase MepM/ murein hydrolase activator NlpD